MDFNKNSIGENNSEKKVKKDLNVQEVQDIELVEDSSDYDSDQEYSGQFLNPKDQGYRSDNLFINNLSFGTIKEVQESMFESEENGSDFPQNFKRSQLAQNNNNKDREQNSQMDLNLNLQLEDENKNSTSILLLKDQNNNIINNSNSKDQNNSNNSSQHIKNCSSIINDQQQIYLNMDNSKKMKKSNVSQQFSDGEQINKDLLKNIMEEIQDDSYQPQFTNNQLDNNSNRRSSQNLLEEKQNNSSYSSGSTQILKGLNDQCQQQLRYSKNFDHMEEEQKKQQLQKDKDAQIDEILNFNIRFGSDTQDDNSQQENQKGIKMEEWAELQKKLTEEFNLVNFENNAKTKLLDELTKQHSDYYKTFMEILEIEEGELINQVSQKKRYLIEEQEKALKSGQLFINEMVIKLIQQPYIIALLVRRHNDNVGVEYKNLVKTLMNSFFDNIIDDEPWNKEIMHFLCELIEIEIERASRPSDIVFEGSSYALKFLKEYCRRPEFHKYTTNLFKPALDELKQIEQRLYMDPQEIYHQTRKKTVYQDDHLSTTAGSSSRKNSVSSHQSKSSLASTTHPNTQQSKPKQSQQPPSTQQGKTSQCYNQKKEVELINLEENGSKIKNGAQIYEQHLKKFDYNSKKGNSLMTMKANNKFYKYQRQNDMKTDSNIHGGNSDNVIVSDLLNSHLNMEEFNKEARFQCKKRAANNTTNIVFDSYNTDNIRNSTFECPMDILNDPDVQEVLIQHIKLMKYMINVTLDQIFVNLENLPTGIRIVCKIIELFSKKKFPNISRQETYKIMGNFLFQIYLMPQFQFPKHYRVLNLVKDNHQYNLQELKKVVMKICRCEFYEHHSIVYMRFNELIQKVSHSMVDYYEELLNINELTVQEIIDRSKDNINQTKLMKQKNKNSDNNNKSNIQKSSFSNESYLNYNMRVFCACISMENIKTLCKMIKKCASEVEEMDPSVVLRAKRILIYAEDDKFFEERNNLVKGSVLKPDQIYVNILETQFPEILQSNFINLYKKSYKLDKTMNDETKIIMKCKNILRQILISIENIDSVMQMNDIGKIGLIDFIQRYQSDFYQKSIFPGIQIDNIPLDLKTQFLLNVISMLPEKYKKYNMKQIFQELDIDHSQREEEFMKVSKQTKAEILKARENIKKIQDIMQDTIDKRLKEIRRKIILHFVEYTKLNICISSPQSRENFRIIIQGDNFRTREEIDEDEDEDGIWIQDKDDCVHTKISGNLEFLKNLNGIGEGNKDTLKHEKNSHCKTIEQLITNFCNLSEVQGCIYENAGNTKIINQAYNRIMLILEDKLSQFREVKNLNAQNKQDQVELSWAMEMLEKYLSLKVYEKIFPKKKSYKDTGEFTLFRLYEWITMDMLQISKINQVDSMWRIAAHEITKIDSQKTPNDKLECFVRSSIIISDVLKLTSIKNEVFGADQAFPVFIYTLLKAQCKRIYSNLQFILNFIKEDKLKSEKGYCLTQIQAALEFFDNLSYDRLFNVQERKFQKMVNLKEKQYGYTTIKKKPRSERKNYKIQDVQNIITTFND